MVVSVVIPTLNEQEFLADAIRSVCDGITPGAQVEILVVDGGSSDGTLRAASMADRVIEAAAGRSNQMNVGAAASRGSVLLFLHADSQLPSGWLQATNEAIRRSYSAGAFRLSFGPSAPLLLRLSATATRIRTPALCFGDRARVVLRERFDHVGGFPSGRVFEDLEIVRRLAASGPFAYLESTVMTSPRRFDSAGTWRQQWANVKLWTRYQLGAHPDSLAEEYPY